MSFNTLSRQATDHELLSRIDACVQTEARNNPAVSDSQLAQDIRNGRDTRSLFGWPVSVATQAAYESAIAAGNLHPGSDMSVVTDGAILSAVQASWPADPEPAV